MTNQVFGCGLFVSGQYILCLDVAKASKPIEASNLKTLLAEAASNSHKSFVIQNLVSTYCCTFSPCPFTKPLLHQSTPQPFGMLEIVLCPNTSSHPLSFHTLPLHFCLSVFYSFFFKLINLLLLYFSITIQSPCNPFPCNHYTVVHVHEPFSLFSQSLHPLPSSLSCHLLSIYESVSIQLVSSVCSLDSPYE